MTISELIFVIMFLAQALNSIKFKLCLKGSFTSDAPGT